MFEAFEYVQNHSDRPIPSPAEFSNADRRKLSDCERRAHLQDYDAVYKRDPLTDDERAWLAEQQAKIRDARPIHYAGVEMYFGPGQIYQVPRGYADPIVALNPGRLRKLTWTQVKAMETANVKEMHFQTVEEAKRLAVSVASGGDDGLRSADPVLEIKDGSMRWGNGPWQPLQRG